MAQSGNSSVRRGAQAPLQGAHPHPASTHPHEPMPLPYHWHEKQEMMQRELEEARARATQMEKTMRWWSDCTANWREKWSKVRSERNKAREEVRILRGRLEVSQRENGTLRREKNDLEAQVTHISKTYHGMRPRKDPSIEQQDDPRDQGSHTRDSPERDGSKPLRPLTQPEAEKLSTDELQFIRDAKNTNFSLLEEIFGSRGLHHHSIEVMGNGEGGVSGEGEAPPQSGGVENVSVFAHKPSEATRLSEKCRAGREVKDLICDEYLQDTAVREDQKTCQHHHHHHHPHCQQHSAPQRENDVEEKMIHTQQQQQHHHHQQHQQQQQQQQQQEQLFREPAGGSSNSSSQPSPSHRISTMSDPLPDTTPCHIVNPRISAVSDPTSEVCGGSECSEGLMEETASRPWEGVAGREMRRGVWRTSGGGSLGGCGSSLLDDSAISPEQESLEQQVTMLKLRLDEATKTIQAEREEKIALDRECSKWQAETSELRLRLEDMRVSRQEAVKELVALRATHQKEVQTLQLEMLDEASTRECIDRRMADLRAELERLQEENAAEWGRRERLESEKLGFEREVKKLRAQLGELEDRLDKRNKLATSCPDSEVAQLKQEIADKFKELSELKHAHAKLKKVLSDKSTELLHCSRRAEQYESEVKRLRGRVDELKKDLAKAEDEVDGASNNMRKLQRGNDELQETVENLEVQVEHLQSRLRSSQVSSLPLRTSALLQDSDDDPGQF